MSTVHNELFRLLAIRRPVDKGKKRPEDKRSKERQQVIEKQQPPTESRGGPTRLQNAKLARQAHLRKLRALDSLRRRARVFGGDWVDAQFKEKPATSIKEGVPRPGLVQRVRRVVLGSERRTVDMRTPVEPPGRPFDASFLDALAKLAEPQERELLTSVRDKIIAPQGHFSWQDLWESLGIVRQQILNDANDTCRDIHVWEDDVRRPDVEAAPSVIQGNNRPSVRAIGFGDLIVARERLVGYRADEVAHIENVLPNEGRLRELEHTVTSELVRETETEEETTRQREFQTTDRFELQSETQKALKDDLKIDAGLKTEGRYGPTKVETSLEASFGRSQEEAHKAASQQVSETVSRAVEALRTTKRERRRSVLTDQLRELNRHTLRGGGTEYSGVYYWVERVHEVELRHYGTRLMFEFFIPEPALSLLPSNAEVTSPLKKPAPLALQPDDIGEDNYRCLAALFGATEVEPPPPDTLQVGYAWASSPEESANMAAQSTKSDTVAVPEGYIPTDAWIAATAYGGDYDEFDLFVAVAGQGKLFTKTSKHSRLSLENLRTAPLGVPIAVRATYNRDNVCAVNIQILCERSTAHYAKWQLRTFERIMEAHRALMAEYQRQSARAAIQQGVVVAGRPPGANRVVEMQELTKWAIKIMRLDSLNVDAVVRQDGREEIDPVIADAFAPIVRFFQDAFEWRAMSYFLDPYFWGRRSSYGYRQTITDPDPLHQAFLRAGAAKVLVPVTPGYETQVLHYLDTQGLNQTELERIQGDGLALGSDDLWLEVLTNKHDDLVRGRGTLSVTQNSKTVVINPQPPDPVSGQSMTWEPTARDVGREVWIGADKYEVSAVAGDKKTFEVAPSYRATTAADAKYAVGSVRVGEPWQVRLPTSLLVLEEGKKKLMSDIATHTPLST